MATLVAPGIHATHLTDQFLQQLQEKPEHLWVPRQPGWPAYSPHHLWCFLQNCCGDMHRAGDCHEDLLLIGFSAGVVASISVARRWQAEGGRVKALIAIDGWGVPLYGNFPIHRMSHDPWTHTSSQWLGGTHLSFYADPVVDHLDMWRSPQTVEGVAVPSNSPWQCWWSSPSSHPPSTGTTAPQFSRSGRLTAQHFLHHLLHHYGEVKSGKTEVNGA